MSLNMCLSYGFFIIIILHNYRDLGFWRKLLIWQRWSVLLTTFSRKEVTGGDVNLHHLAEVIFARFFRYKITLPPPPPLPCFSVWKEVTVRSSHVRSGKLCSTCLRADYLHKVFGIFLPRRCLISLTYLFFQSLIYITPWLLLTCIFKNLFIYFN